MFRMWLRNVLQAVWYLPMQIFFWMFFWMFFSFFFEFFWSKYLPMFPQNIEWHTDWGYNRLFKMQTLAVCMLRNDDASKHIMDCLIRCGHSAESNLRNKEVMDCLIRYGHSAVCMLRNDDASKHIMDRSIRCGHSAESNLRNEPRCNWLFD